MQSIQTADKNWFDIDYLNKGTRLRNGLMIPRRRYSFFTSIFTLMIICMASLTGWLDSTQV
jgi:hypothetical protein